MKRSTVLALVIAACSKSAPEAEKAPDPVAEIHSAPAEAGVAADSVTAYGVAEAGAGGERTLVAPIEATVAAVLAAPGTAVRAGQPIVTLTPGPTARVDLTKANTDAASAAATLARARRLRADGLMSDADVEVARAAAASAATLRASLAGREAGLVLRAPVMGTVAAVANAPGDLVAAGTTVVRVAARGALRARFGVEPQTLTRLRLGGAVSVRASGGGAAGGSAGSGGAGGAQATARTRIVAIDPLVDPQTRLASVFTPLPAAAGAGAGEALVATFALGGDVPGVTVPYAALADDAGKPFVFVIQGGTAHKREVATGAQVGERIVVAQGLKAGERVAVDGLTALEDGIKVREAAPATATKVAR